MEVWSAVRAVVNVPLVMHGTGGVPDEQVRDAVRRDICKVNYATDLRIAFTNGVKAYMNDNPNAFDPKKYSVSVMKEVTAQFMTQDGNKVVLTVTDFFCVQ